MRLFLIRHGETAWTVMRRYQGTTDTSLNAEGLKQAQAIARTLQKEKITRLYCSTLKRARDTARLIGQKLKLKPAADSRLNEISFGKWEGAYYRNLYAGGGRTFTAWRRGKLRRPPGGESVDSLARRVGQFLKELVERYPDDTVAVVSHGGPIKMFLFKILKAKQSSIWSFRIDPASLSLIEGDKNLLQIVWTNRTSHLQ